MLSANGGLVGENSSAPIQYSYSVGSVIGEWWVGGLVGSNGGYSSIGNCYNKGNVSGENYVGGLVGENGTAPILYSYSVGNVTGEYLFGGLIGYNSEYYVISYSFWDIETSGQNVSDGGTGKTTTQMKNISTYTDITTEGLYIAWDFWGNPYDDSAEEDFWGINSNDNGGYPFLMWQGFDNLFQQPSGTGFSSDPYLISNLNELAWISVVPNSWSSYFLQTADIDGSDTHNWYGGIGFIPIGKHSNIFTGLYNGDSCIIDSLFIKRTENSYNGLFGKTNQATIENLGLTNLELEGGPLTGGIIGYAENTSLEKCFITGNVNGNDLTGGLIGKANYSIINKSFCKGNVSGSFYTGGVIGYSDNTATTNCYCTANVTGSFEIGGFVGRMFNAIVTNCYSTGNVSGTNDIGGLIGKMLGYMVTTSFWDTETSNQTTSAGGTGKTTLEMKDYVTFYNAGWDFMEETTNGSDNVWGINPEENGGYPFLSWQGFSHNIILDAPTDITIFVVGNEVTISWTEVTGASSYKIFAADLPNGVFEDITEDGTFDRKVLPTSSNSKIFLKKIHSLKNRANVRTTQSWTATIEEENKFYYIIASN